MPLTDTEIARERWRPKAFTLTDTRGLRLACYPRGVKTWQLHVTGLNRASRVVTVGHWPAMTVRTARVRARDLRARARRGEDLGRIASRVTVAAFAKRYLDEVAAKSRKDVAPVKRCFARAILPRLGTHSVAQVTAGEIQKLVFAKRDQGYPAAAAQIRNLLKRLFDYAMACGLCPTNPVLQTPMKFVYNPKSRARSLSAAELKVFLAKVRPGLGAKLHWRYGTVLELLLLTLARKSELRLALWSDIDWEARTWEVPAENSKTGKPHIVYLSRQAIALLGRLWPLDCEQPASNHAFAGTRRMMAGELILQSQSSRTQPISECALNRAMARMKWGIPHFTPHDLRRTASTILNEKGYEPDWIEKALNHAPQGIRAVYNRAQYAEQRKRMLQEWADWLEGLK